MANATNATLSNNQDYTVGSSINTTIGLVLAVLSGFLIGSAFIIKKKGLLQSNLDYHTEAGEGHAYLKSWMWWAGLIMMASGELCNVIAYALAAAIIVTPLGALSVVVSAVLSSLILKERLNFYGKMGCALCVLGAVVIVLHAPAQSGINDIPQFMSMVIQAPFLVYCGLVLVASLFLIFWAMPRYGKTHMVVPIAICSIIGSISVVFTQGMGAAFVASFTTNTIQFKYWFTYFTIFMVLLTQLFEIHYLNVALNRFNTAMVTPVYYVLFTTSVIVATAVLFQGFKASPKEIATVAIGFAVIVIGVVMLQVSRVEEEQQDKLKAEEEGLQANGDASDEDDEVEATSQQSAISISESAIMQEVPAESLQEKPSSMRSSKTAIRTATPLRSDSPFEEPRPWTTLSKEEKKAWKRTYKREWGQWFRNWVTRATLPLTLLQTRRRRQRNSSYHQFLGI